MFIFEIFISRFIFKNYNYISVVRYLNVAHQLIPFYNKPPPPSPPPTQCYVFHLYVGVRAGGGIGDEIDSPDGDPSEVYRILFDITFFFFVIVILLAIIQGLKFSVYSHRYLLIIIEVINILSINTLSILKFLNRRIYI